MKDTIEGSRMVAFLIIDGKVYESDCDHQDCLEQYYIDKNIESEFDYSDPDNYDDVHEQAVKKTYQMKNNHKVYGFDLFDADGLDWVLVAHDEETLNVNRAWADQYCNQNDCKLAYFTGRTWECEVV